MSSKRLVVKLEELGEIVGGATPSTKNSEYWDGDIPWISPKDLTGYRYRYIKKGQKCITQDGFDSCSTRMLPEGTILFSSRAPIGYCAIAKNPVCTNQGFKSIIPKEGIDSEFLYYLVLANKEKIAGVAFGTTFPEVSGKVMRQFEVEIPEDPSIQKAIANIIGSIDSKIENNLRLNDYLAELGDALFREEFGDLEENAVLSDITNITMGQSPAGTSYNEDGNGTVFYQGRGEFGWRYPKQRLFTTEPKRMAKAGDVLMSVRAPVGDLNLAYEDCCIGRGLAAISCDYPSYCFYLMRSLRKKLDAYNGEGTVFGSISGKALKNLAIALPKPNAIKIFEEEVAPIDATIRSNETESRGLTELRDTLLPKLMFGEIGVSNVNTTQLRN